MTRTKTQDRKIDKPAAEKVDTAKEIFREVITIRPTTTTRPPFTITVQQRVAENNEVALSTAVYSRALDLYHEKPELMEDTANSMIYAARLMRKLNKKVKNGK